MPEMGTMLRTYNDVRSSIGGCIVVAAAKRSSIRPEKTVSAPKSNSHLNEERHSENVSAPSKAIMAQSMTAPVGTNPPSVHWNTNGSSKLASIWRNCARLKFLDAAKYVMLAAEPTT